MKPLQKIGAVPLPMPVSDYLRLFGINRVTLRAAQKKGLLTVRSGHVITDAVAIAAAPSNARQAKALRSPRAVAVFSAINAGAHDVASVADATGLSVNQVHQVLRPLRAANLVKRGPGRKKIVPC